MKPIEFEGQNVVFAKDQPEYNPLPAFRNNSPEGEVVTKWELSEEDLEAINETGCIWLQQMTFNNPLQPILLSSKPLITLTDEG